MSSHFSSNVESIARQAVASSLLSKTLYAVAISGFLLQLVLHDFVITNFCISVQQLGTHLWTVLTFWLIETNVFVLLGDILCAHLAGVLLEPVWTTGELVKFFVIVNVCLSISATLTLFLAYLLGLATEQSFFDMPVHGLSGFNAAILVGVKQMLPDAVLLTTPLGRIKNNNLPSVMFVLCVLLTTLRVMKWIVPAMYINGSFFAWIYLRYYQLHENGAVGDPADHFAFVTFFPSMTHGFVAPVCNTTYRLLVRLGICKPTIRRYVDVHQMTSVNVILPGTEQQDAERRRQKALRELTERLERSRQSDDSTAWPAMTEGESPVAMSPPLPVDVRLAAAAAQDVLSSPASDADAKPTTPNIPQDSSAAIAQAHRASSMQSSNEQLTTTADDAHLELQTASPPPHSATDEEQQQQP